MVRAVKVMGMVGSDGFEGGGGRFRMPIRGGGRWCAKREQRGSLSSTILLITIEL